MDKGKGWSLRFSETIGVDFLYVAQPLQAKSGSVMTVRLALPLSDMQNSLSKVRNLIFGASLLGVLLALGVSFLVAHRIFQPVKELTRTARSISSGNLTTRLRRYPDHEIGDLGRAFDRMADHLQEEIESATQRREYLETILRGMIEAVLVTDDTGRITLANRALLGILKLEASPIGRKPSEIFRNPSLIEAIGRVSAGQKMETIEVRTLRPPARTLDVVVARLPGDEADAGVVAVFHDITERKRIEEMRRDFVANVSHELRTPLAAIRGSVETLLEGALDNPEFARQFTEVIERHVKRLEEIVLDLLELARLEAENQDQPWEDIQVDGLLKSSRAAVADLAEDKDISLEIEIEDEALVLHGDRRNLEQALVNLTENAIKYTGEGGRIVLRAHRNSRMIEFEVEDTGKGIPPEHLPRIFERFYRVDQNRSREGGGTGLGLAIVKHIAQSHHGRVEVDSTPGKGSTFRLLIPVG